jgi:hypothetical protein
MIIMYIKQLIDKSFISLTIMEKQLVNNNSKTDNNNTIKQPEVNKKLEEFMKKQEAKGEEATTYLMKNNIVTMENVSNILQKGFDEFFEENGRTMTYSEMRDMYG